MYGLNKVKGMSVFMKKNILWMSAICTLFSGIAYTSHITALEVKSEDLTMNYSDYCNSSLLGGLGNIVRDSTIDINGIENPLYCTFDNKNDAIQKLQERIPTILSVIANVYKLESISDKNWEEYSVGMQELLQDDILFESDEEFRILSAFFDIYENDGKNKEIQEYINNNSLKLRSINMNSSSGVELSVLLPYYAPFAKNVQENILNQSLRNSKLSTYATDFNVNLAISYAGRRAIAPNTTDYDYFKNADCANFASQILDYCGVKQEVYDNKNLGWWHKTGKNWLGQTTHSHSLSWTMADTFSRYMGVGYTSRSIYEFSENIQPGDFIAFDEDNDGDWDHVGFVTEKNYTAMDYDNGYYFDFKVAQHSKDYHDWASSSINSWELVEQDGGRYARVRR